MIITALSVVYTTVYYPPVFGQSNRSGESMLHDFVKYQIELGSKADRWLEGYARTITGEPIVYRSSSPGVNDALLCRATDGTMAVAWETECLPYGSTDSIITYVWLCGLGVNMGEKEFTLTTNSAHPLTFRSSNKVEWTSLSTDGVRLDFRAVTADVHNDLFGYMFLHVPRKMLKPGELLRIHVTGENGNSRAWFMVFKSDRVIDTLRKIAHNGFWYKLEWEYESTKMLTWFPAVWSGKTITISNNRGMKSSAVLQSYNAMGQASFLIDKTFYDSTNFTLEISIGETTLDRLEFPVEKLTQSEIRGDQLFVLHTINRHDGRTTLEGSGHPIVQYDSIMRIADSYFRDGALHLITSSHQDIAWMDDPFTCIADRDSIVITPALRIVERNPDYKYSVEDALMLKEYITRHPERIPDINKYTTEGRLEWGATYNQPYEGLNSGEALIRQLYFGRKWLKKILPGCDARVAWNLDVPGRTLQMPQILKKSGVDYLLLSRHERGFFHWQSPDGSSVGAYSPGHYHIATDFLRYNDYESFFLLPQSISLWEPFYKTYSLPPHVPFLFTSDMSSPKDFSGLMNLWNFLRFPQPDIGRSSDRPLPRLQYDIARTALDAVFAKGSQLPTIQGERPNVWLYIHGPTHHWAISAAREGAILLTAAEKFSAINALLEKSMLGYPQVALSDAWEAHIYPDHGWGGKDGNITDSLFRSKYEFAMNEGKRILEKALDGITAEIRIDVSLGIPLTVFNELSWERTDPVRAELQFEEGTAFEIRVIGNDQKEIPSELHNIVLHNDGSLKKAEVLFIAEEIPSVGYRTYYVQSLMGPPSTPVINRSLPGTIENRFYTITLVPGGITRIFDNELGIELFNTEKFLAGELFTMQSVGTGAGEFSEVQQPTMEGFDKLSNYTPRWELLSNGAVSTCARLEQKIQHCLYRQQITVYKNIKRIDFDIEILGWDGTEYREFRLALPLNMKKGTVTYEVPFGTVTVGKDEIPGAAGERYVQKASEVHPREVQDWISASDEHFGITLSSSVAVCDYLDPTDDPIPFTVLQPVLLASRRSCHGEGNWYLQAGDHRYHFSLFSHRSGWNLGYRHAKQANAPLRVCINRSLYRNPILPPEYSFCSTSSDNVIISTIKKCEDDSSLIIRCYEMEGKDTECSIQLFTPQSKIEKVNLVEEEARPLPAAGKNIDISIMHHAIETYKIWPSK